MRLLSEKMAAKNLCAILCSHSSAAKATPFGRDFND